MINICFKMNDYTTKTISIEDIINAFGLKDAVKNTSTVEVRLDSHVGTLVTTLTDAADFPGVDVDAEMNGKYYYATSVELPNPHSDVIVSRLYCGDADIEYDGPAVIMPLGDRAEDDESKRVVFYDGDLACATNMSSGRYRKMSCEELYRGTTENSLCRLKVDETK